jgi:hypothetical protein
VQSEKSGRDGWLLAAKNPEKIPAPGPVRCAQGDSAERFPNRLL